MQYITSGISAGYCFWILLLDIASGHWFSILVLVTEAEALVRDIPLAGPLISMCILVLNTTRDYDPFDISLMNIAFLLSTISRDMNVHGNND